MSLQRAADRVKKRLVMVHRRPGSMRACRVSSTASQQGHLTADVFINPHEAPVNSHEL